MKISFAALSLAFALTAPLAPAAAQAPTVNAASRIDGPTRQISFAKMAARIPAGTPWAHIQADAPPFPCSDSRTLTWDAKANEAFQDPELERVFRAELSEAGVSVAGDPTNLFERDSKSSELQIGALVTGLQSVFCSRTRVFGSDTISGSTSMQIEWQIYSTVDARIIARIPTTGSYLSKSGIDAGNVIIIQRAFAQNVRNLVASDSFRTAVKASPPTGKALPSAGAISFSASASGRRTPAQTGGGVAVIFAGQSMGSAFLISSDGYLLTNQHVVGDATRVRIRWSDKTETLGEVIRSDRRRDVAVVKADAKGRTPLALRHDGAEPGEPVFAIGTPLDKDFQNTVTRGIVSANRTIDGQTFIQSDVAVDFGNSGGPLVDDQGRVLAITDWGYSPDGVSHNLNFFIPIDDALKALGMKPAG